MAAIGLSKEEIVSLLPEGIYIACQNSSTRITISGPEVITKEFVKKLNEKGIFARIINSVGIALHTKYEASKYGYEFLKNVIGKP